LSNTYYIAKTSHSNGSAAQEREGKNPKGDRQDEGIDPGPNQSVSFKLSTKNKSIVVINLSIFFQRSIPLGRTLDFLQEDIDMMQKEIHKWSDEYEHNVKALKRQQM
jgi:hypothetical protein